MSKSTSTLIVLFALAILAASAVVLADDCYQIARETHAGEDTSVYYPTNGITGDEDDCTLTVASGQKFPAVIFLQGGSVDAQYYSIIASKIASQGYIVAVPNAPRLIMFGVEIQLTTPNATVSARDLLRSLDADSTSGIYGLLQDNEYSFVGHSFGGVMATIAGANDAVELCTFPSGQLSALCNGYGGFGAGLKAVVTYGASMVDRSRGGGVTIFNPNTTGVPNVLILAKNDGRVLRSDVETTYDSCLETPKAFIELDYANHFGITDSQVIAGASTDSSAQTKPQGWSTSQIAKIIGTALDAHVKNDADAHKKIYTKKSFGPPFITVSASEL